MSDRLPSDWSERWKLLAFTAALVAAGCSSIPEVTFEDRDGSGEDSGPGDGGADALDETDYVCPSRPPPSSVGICCSLDGTPRLCLKCASTNDCGLCSVADCTGTMSSGKVCCRKNSVRVTCDEAADCL